MTNFIFVTGGVVSSLGKGLAAASLAALLQARGYRVRLRKLDPYLNVDPGTMSPYQHGEVFVTDDGTEADLDLGHYERFTNVSATVSDSTTTGKIYANVLQRERRGDYLGATVQVVPHVIDEIKAFIMKDAQEEDFLIVEIGGTVGDIESLPHLEAIRQLGYDLGRDRTLFLHLTLLPYIPSAGELKTKPSQHSVKELLSVGIQPDFLLCRCDRPIPEEARRKLALFCNLQPEKVIAAIDVDTIYQVPLKFYDQRLDQRICTYFGLPENASVDLSAWKTIVQRSNTPKHKTKVAIVGKYLELNDAYLSLTEALKHAGVANDTRVELNWVDAEDLANLPQALEGARAVLIPGGFGSRGVEGKIQAIRWAREKKIPFLGICMGMQLSVIEASRNLLGLQDASSTEFGPTSEPVVALLKEWLSGEQIERRSAGGDLGGTMRVGSYPCVIQSKSLAEKIYQQLEIQERHRHRYEVNMNYRTQLESVGLIFSGLSPDGALPEIVERADHPWFVGVQFHPEFKSRPFAPHPLFVSFIQASL